MKYKKGDILSEYGNYYMVLDLSSMDGLDMYYIVFFNSGHNGWFMAPGVERDILVTSIFREKE